MTLGKTPVPTFNIETISDPNDYRLNLFRDRIFTEDLGLSASMRHEDQSHVWWHTHLGSRIAEDAFKFCDRKWDTLEFDNIEAVIEGDEIVGMSGCRTYGPYLRTSMHLYLLKRVRAVYPGIKYLSGGWFERHMTYARGSNLKGMFFTVYAYNRKLKGLINNHRGRIISLVDPAELLYINDVVEIGEFEFNQVPQTFFYYPLTDNNFDINEAI